MEEVDGPDYRWEKEVYGPDYCWETEVYWPDSCWEISQDDDHRPDIVERPGDYVSNDLFDRDDW
jgi:hypothetical protein